VCEDCSPKPDSRTEGQSEGRVSSRIQSDRNFLKNVITGDEPWIFEYDPETKRQSKEWHTSASPRPKKARRSKSKIKSMLICFFDSQGIVHTEFVPQGQTVDQFYYCEILEILKTELFACNHALRTIGCSITTMPLVTWRSLRSNFWQKRAFLWFHSPPYSPDLSPCDFFLFP